MAKARKQKLKVFQAQLGFYESVVAAPSQAAALEAWGVRQNLFAEGQAHLATDEAASSAALAHPGQPLRRAIGDKGRFEVEPAGLPSIPGHKPRRGAAAPTSKPRAKPAASAKPPPDRSDLDEAEAALKTLERTHQDQLAEFERRRAALEAEQADADEAFARRRDKAASEVDRQRRAYVRAGGRV